MPLAYNLKGGAASLQSPCRTGMDCQGATDIDENVRRSVIQAAVTVNWFRHIAVNIEIHVVPRDATVRRAQRQTIVALPWRGKTSCTH